MSLDQHEDHGNSVAAWVGVCVLLVAAVLIAIGVASSGHVWTILGVIVGAVGLIVAMVLARTGFGVAAKRSQESAVSEQGETGRG